MSSNAEREPLTQRRIGKMYAPLAASWLFMAIEGPISIAILSRMPNAELFTAAFMPLMGLSMWIESPVIDLLSTSTALSRDKNSYGLVRRFTLWLMLLVMLVHGAVALTPLYGLVTESLIGLPPPVARAMHVPFMIMIPWSAFIGWRRHLQGILIRHSSTQAVGWGTTVRMLALICVGVGAALFSGFPGIWCIAIALVVSVAAECLFIHVASRKVLAVHYSHVDGHASLTMGALVKFHVPLALATVVMFTSSPMVSAAIANLVDPVGNLAAWQVASSMVFMFRTIVFALPEVVIALVHDDHSRAQLKTFCLRVGAGTLGLLMVFALTGLDRWVFSRLLGASPEISRGAHLAVLCSLALPGINAAISFVRGMLAVLRRTMARLWAVGASVGTLALALSVGVWLKQPGVAVAGLSLIASALAEWIVLTLALRRSRSAA